MNSLPHPRLLIVPGLSGSGPDHWQTRWCETLPDVARLEQDDWDNPELFAWSRRLHEAIEINPGAILIAHSLGAILVAHLAGSPKASRVAGALLVAPADVERLDNLAPRLPTFSSVPHARLPFPSAVVASTDDPYLDIRRAEEFARNWGSRFHNVGACGHINAAAGYGDWVEGEMILEELCSTIASETMPTRDRPRLKNLSR